MNIFSADSEYPRALYNKGDILVCLNRIDEGIIWITKAIEKIPD